GYCWTSADSHEPWPSGARTAPRYVRGISSSTPGANSAKKFGRKLSHSTLRRLVILAVTVAPARSQVSVSPSLKCSDSAIPSSIDSPASGPLAAPNHLPAVTRLVFGRSLAHDRLNSRSASLRARVSNRVVSNGSPLTATIRPRIIG